MGEPSEERWPFVGRSSQLALGRRALRTQRGVIVFGEGGVGKTSLAHALATEVDGEPRWHVVTGAKGAGGVAFGAWSHLLPDAWEGGLDDATAWRALADHLRSPGGAVHLVVEDAHWLDAGSAAFLHHLVSTNQAVAAVTSRREVTAQPPITSLWKDGHLARIDLEPFTPDEVALVVEAALGAPVEPGTIARLHGRTGGNADLVRALVEDGRRSGTLQLVHGAWIETAPTRPSARLVDLLAERIDELRPEERAVVEVLAVAGPLDGELLAQISAPARPRRSPTGRFVRLERTGSRAVATLTDPLIGEVLLARLDVGRRDEILGLVADQLGLAPDLTDDDVLRLAAWRVELGRAIDPDDALRAADLASARRDFALAERLVVATGGAGGDPATVRLGEALMRQERHVEADATLRPVGGRLEGLDDDLRFRYANARAMSLISDLGRIEDAIEVLESTIATMADDRSRWALEAHLSFLLADCGRLTAARPLAEARLANVDRDEPSALTALVAGALIRTYGGRCLDTLDLCRELTPIALRHLDDRPEALAWVVAAQMLATYVRGELDAADELIDAMALLTADDPDPTIRAGLLMSQGLVLVERGQLDAALRVLRQAAALHEFDNRRGYQAWCFAITSRVHALRGDVDEAAALLATARRHLWSAGQAFGGDVHVAAIWVATLGGDRAGATRILDEALAWAQDQGMATVDLRLRHEAIRAGLPIEPHVEAFAQTRVSDQSLWARAQTVHVAALAADDGTGLVEAGDEFGALGFHLLAAEAYAQGAGAHRRAGSSALAAQAKQLSDARRARCEAAATPALRFGELVVGLTDRELDVTTRAAAGQANQEIATALGISVRTAETHLQRAFAKLGIHRRRELATIFGPSGPDRQP